MSGAAEARDVARAALDLIDGVGDDERSSLCLPFADSEQRRTWFYWPGPRAGVPLGALDDTARALVHRLVKSVLQLPAYAKVVTIIALEDVLAEIEGDRARAVRNPEHYCTSIFGEPSGADPWGFRFEGHHVSVHVTVADGQLAPTPLFLGSNPAEVVHGGRVIARPLAEEEDVARALYASLPTAQRKRATIDDTAPDDIVTSNAPRVEHELEGGVPVRDLTGEARTLADELIAIYRERTTVRTVDVDTGELFFAWAGPDERGAPHYYRLSGSRFLAEYDNTQNGANHAHAVWRDPQGDFGDDLLRAHRAAMHTSRETGSSSGIV
jgi:hypothetical protein